MIRARTQLFMLATASPHLKMSRRIRPRGAPLVGSMYDDGCALILKRRRGRRHVDDAASRPALQDSAFAEKS